MTPWRAADRAYQAHHVSCAQCKAAGKRLSDPDRCEEGARLWAHYQAQPLPHVLADRPRMMNNARRF